MSAEVVGFAALSERMQKAVQLLESLLAGRRDCYARKYIDPKTQEARAATARVAGKFGDKTGASDLPLTLDVWADHVMGREHVGVYPMVENNVAWACIDIDREGDWIAACDTARPILRAAAEAEIPLEAERSKGKGIHLWLFLDGPVPAFRARALLRLVCAQAEVRLSKRKGKGFETVVYPPQDELSEDDRYGNLVFAPLCGSLVPEGKTAFLDPDTLEPWPDQIEAVSAFERLPAARVLEMELHPDNVRAIGKVPPTRRAPEPVPDDLVRAGVGECAPLSEAEFRFLAGKLPALRTLVESPSLAGYDDWLAGLVHLVPFERGETWAHDPRFYDAERYDPGETTRKWGEAVKIYTRPDRAGSASLSQRIIHHAREGGRPDIVPISWAYGVQAGRFVRRKYAEGKGEVNPIPLCNFVAYVVSVDAVSDGEEIIGRRMKIRVEVSGSGRVFEFDIPSSKWSDPKSWLPDACAHNAIIYANTRTGDFLECMSIASVEAPHRQVFSKTGWITHTAGLSFVLTRGPVVGPDLGADVAVDVPASKLAMYDVRPVETEEAILEGYEWVIRLIRCAEPRVTAPLVAAMFLAPIASWMKPGFALMFGGRTGSHKSALVAAALNLFGCEFDYKRLPASFMDTINNIERMGHWAADIPFVIDNYVPRVHKEAPRVLHRILHSVGDDAGRGRMTSRLGVVAGKPFRCLTIITGEDFPQAQSDAARAYVVEMQRGTVDETALYAVQAAGARGGLRPVMTRYLGWLHRRLADAGWIKRLQTDMIDSIRKRQFLSADHGRVLDQLGQLEVGWRLMRESAPKWSARHTELLDRCEVAMVEDAPKRADVIRDTSLTHEFFRAVMLLIESGIAYAVDSKTGEAPENPGMWGWRTGVGSEGYGRRFHNAEPILWVHQRANYPPVLLLQPDLTLAKIQGMDMMRATWSSRAVSNALDSDGLLWRAKGDPPSVSMCVMGVQRRVWRIHVPGMLKALGVGEDDEVDGAPVVRLEE